MRTARLHVAADDLGREHGRVLLRLNALRSERDVKIRAAMAGTPLTATSGSRFLRGLRSVIGS